MKILILFLIPIAASNTFGFVRFLLIQYGVVEDIGRLWRGLPFLLAVVLVVALAKTKNTVVGYTCIFILILGALCSLGGVWLGFQVGSTIAMILGCFWFLAFSLGSYKLPSILFNSQKCITSGSI